MRRNVDEAVKAVEMVENWKADAVGTNTENVDALEDLENPENDDVEELENFNSRFKPFRDNLPRQRQVG